MNTFIVRAFGIERASTSNAFRACFSYIHGDGDLDRDSSRAASIPDKDSSDATAVVDDHRQISNWLRLSVLTARDIAVTDHFSRGFLT